MAYPHLHDGLGFETGPIRPPSEARSLLVRVSRNCPWNRCAFCPVYKQSEGYSRRRVSEVHADLDAMQAVYGDGVRTVFLQDADPMLANPNDLVAILARLHERFPHVERVTTYARSKTLARRSVADLTRVREAGLDRVHVGLESGADAVLSLVNKGVTRKEQIEGGRRAKEAGYELSVYVMPGLGGRELSREHADETASAVAAIEPDFVRLRSTAVVPGTPLAELEAEGRFTALGELAMVEEIRRFLGGLSGVRTRLESDHALNLLMELRGDLPDEHARLLAVVDTLLALPEDDQILFVLGRRTNRLSFLGQLERPGVREELAALREECLPDGQDPEAVFRALRLRWI
jgi:radical SAM superfamily enzyme